MECLFADLHVHIGRTKNGDPVKISASKHLTLQEVIHHAVKVKGMDILGIIDCHVPAVLDEIQELIFRGELEEHADGGLMYQNGTVILGSEIEIYDDHCSGPIHVLVYFPYFNRMKHFSDWLSERTTNINLSSQRYYGTATELQTKVNELGGFLSLLMLFPLLRACTVKVCKGQ